MVRKGMKMVTKNLLSFMACFSLILFTVSCKDEGGDGGAESSAKGSVSQSVNTFNAVLPESLEISPTSISNFVVSDGVSPGNSSTIFVVNNSEAESGLFSEPVYSGPGASAFQTISNTCNTSISPGGFCSFSVQFAPSTNGTFNGVVTINSANMSSNMTSLSGVANGFGTSPLLTGVCPSSVNQDVDYSCQLESNDPDAGETYTWSFTANNTCEWAVINDSTGEITGSANDDQVGSCNLAVKVNDGTEDSNIVVSPVVVSNVKPTLVIAGVSLDEDSGLTEIHSDSDVQSNEEGFGVYSIEVSGGVDCSSHGQASINSQNGSINFTPNPNFAGLCNITVKFDDGNSVNNIVDSQFQVSVNPINDLPVISQSCSMQSSEGLSYNCEPTVTDSDSNAFTWSFSSGNTCDWLSINSNTGVMSGTPNDDQVGNCTLTFKANDGLADSNEINLNINVENIAPTLNIADTSIDEDSGLTVIRSNSDVQSNTERFGVYSIVSAATNDCSAHGLVSINSNNGEVSYKVNPGFNGFCNIKVQFDDENTVNNIVSSEFMLTVNPVNDAPVLSQSCLAMVNQGVNYNCEPTVTDSDSNTFTWSFASTNTCDWLSIDQVTGAISGTANDDQVGNCNLSFKVSDGELSSNVASISLEAINLAPTLSLSDTSINEDAVGQIIKSDGDVQSDTEGMGVYSFIQASNDDCSSVGTKEIDSATGEISFEVNAGFNGLCKIKVQFDDENNANNLVSSEFSLTVNPVNDAPVLSQNCLATVDQDMNYNCAPSANDEDGDSLFWSLTAESTCAWASIDNGTGVISGTPNDDQVGSCLLDFNVSDGSLEVSSGPISIGVVNKKPVLEISSANLDENSGLQVIKSDLDVQSNEEGFGVYKIISASNGDCSANGDVQIDSSNGEISFNPSLNYNGLCKVNVEFDDQNSINNIVTAEFDVVVNSVNDAPVISQNCIVEINQDSLYSCVPSVTDSDNTSFTWVLSNNTSCAWLSIDSASGEVSGTPNDDQVGICTFDIMANDGIADSNLLSVELAVNNVMPTLSLSNVSVQEDASLSVIQSDSAVGASDEGFGKYSLINSAADDCSLSGSLTIDENNGELSYKPAENYTGICNVTVQFNDENLVDNKVIEDFTVSVIKVNDTPLLAQSCTTGAAQDGLYECAPTVIDPDLNDTHTWSFADNNSCNWLTINSSTGVITGSPNDDEVGGCSLQFSVSDGGSSSSIAVVNISIENIKPSLEISDIEINEDSGFSVIASDSQVQSSEEGFGKYSLLTAASNDCKSKGTASIDENSGAISYSPNSNFTGACSFKVQFDDENNVNNIVSANFELIVKGVNDLATITHSCGTNIKQDEIYTCDPKVNDPDSSDTHIWSFAGTNTCSWANIDSATGKISGQPNDDQVGSCNLGFKVNDGTADSQLSIINVVIENKSPTLNITSTEIDEDSALAVVRSNSDVQSSEEGFGIYSLENAGSADCSNKGSLSIDSSSGAISYAPNHNYNGSCKVKVKFDDQNAVNNTVVAEFFIDVNVVNDIPVLSENCPISINQDQNYSCAPVVTDPDLSDSHTWALTSANTCGHLSINGNTGVISGTADDNQVGSCKLGFVVNDGKASSLPKLINVTVNNVKPTLNISDASLSEDSPLTIIKSDSDVQASEEGFGVYSLVLAAGTDCSTKGQVAIKPGNGEISYKPSANFVGSCNINVLFNDENSINNFAMSQFSVEVNDNNSAPVISIACSKSVKQDELFRCQPSVQDNNPEDSHIWSLASGNACSWVSINEQTGLVTGTPKDSDVGSCKLSLSANDGRVDSLAKDLIVNVINKKPILVLADVTIDEDSGLKVIKTDSEVQANEEGDGIYSIVTASTADCSGKGLAIINEDNGELSFRSETDTNGTCNMAISFNDGNLENNIVISQFAVNIKNVNDAPLIFATCKTKVMQDEPYECKPSILDLDNNDKHGWAFSKNNTCDWLTISSSTGVMTGLPNDNQVGNCKLEFQTYDLALYSEVISFDIIVENTSPTLEIASVAVDFGENLILEDSKVQASEEGFGKYSFDIASSADCQAKGIASINEDNGSILFKPETGFSGECKLNVIFDDQNSTDNIARSEFSVLIGEDPTIPVNTAPFFTLVPTRDHGYGGGEVISDISAQEGKVASEDNQVVSVKVVSSSNLAVLPLENINVVCEDLGDGCNGSVSAKSIKAGSSTIILEVSDGSLVGQASYEVHFGQILVENIYPVKNWNEYVKKTGVNKLDIAEVVPCDNSVDKKYADGCIHAGESRKVELSAETSCFGLTLKDELDVWEWVCDDSGSNVVFYTSGLLEDKGLSDIIENNKFKSNSVTLSRGCEVLAKSGPKIWDWTNPIKRLPSSKSGVVRLAEKGSIFVSESDMTGYGYSIEANEVALVIDKSDKFTFDSRSRNTCNRRTGSRGRADITSAVSVSGKKHLWIEGQFKSVKSRRVTNMLNLVNMSYSRVQNVDTEHTKDGAYYLKDSHSNFMQNIRSNACYKHAVHLDNSKYNFIYNLKTSECGRGLIVENNSNNNLFMKGVLASNDIIRGDFTQGRGIFFKNNSDNNSLVKMAVLSSDRHSIMFENSNDQNTLSHITVANALSGGITIDSNSNENSISSVVAMNTGKGIHMTNSSKRSHSQNNKFNDIYSVGNGRDDVSLEKVAGNTFHGNLYTSTNRCNIKGVSSNAAGMNSSCKKDGLSTHAHFGGKSSDIFKLWLEESNKEPVNMGRGLASVGGHSHHGHKGHGKGHYSHGNGLGKGHYKHSHGDSKCSKYGHMKHKKYSHKKKHKKVACVPRPKHDHKDMCEHKIKHDHGKHNGHHKKAKAYGYGKKVKTCHGHGHGKGNKHKNKHHKHKKKVVYCDEVEEIEEEEVLMCLSPREERRIASLSGAFNTGVKKFTSITDWHKFEDFFAGWQFDGGKGQPGVKHRSSCDSSWHNCVATSLKPKASFQNLNGEAVIGEACPASVDQSKNYDVVMTDKMETPYHKGIVAVEKIGNGNGICEVGEVCNNQYIVNAVEIMFDGLGDDDGLCESNERCTYASTLGAHQEFGSYDNKTCAFTDGRVKNVKMYVYK